MFSIHFFFTSVLGATPHHIPLNIGVQLRKVRVVYLRLYAWLAWYNIRQSGHSSMPSFCLHQSSQTRKHIPYVCLGIIAGMHVYNNTVYLYSFVIVLEVHLVGAD